MSWISDIAGGVVSGIATPISNAWVETKKSNAAMHEIDKKTERDITIENFRADVQIATAQQLLALADQSHWSTRWIRPAFAALSFCYVAMALFGYLPATPIPPAVEYLLVGIPGAIFLLRPMEKNKRVDIAANAQKAPVAPGVLSKLRLKRGDDA